MSNLITVDIESTGFDPFTDTTHLISYRIGGVGPVTTVDVSLPDFKSKNDYHTLKALLERKDIRLRGQNVKFDAHFLCELGIDLDPVEMDDTRVHAYTVYPDEPHGLKDLAVSKLGRDPVKMKDFGLKIKKKHQPFFDASPKYLKSAGKYFLKKKFIAYNKDDVINCDDLKATMPYHPWFGDVERPLTKVLFKSERRGIRIDREHLRNLDAKVSKELEELRKDIGLENPRSPKQVQHAFSQRYDLSKYAEKTKTGYSTDSLFLKHMAWRNDELAQKLLRFRHLDKMKCAFIDRLLRDSARDGRVHGFFNQAGKEESATSDGTAGTASGRLTSVDPNLQQIPSRTELGKEIRKAFIPTDGYVMFNADLKQIEPRLVGHHSQSPKLIYAYKNGIDTHAMFGADIFKKTIETLSSTERFVGKTSWLATVYLCSYKKLLAVCEKYSDDPLDLNLEPYFKFWDYADSWWGTDFKKEQARLVKSSPTEEEARIKHAQWMFFREVQDAFERANPEIFAWRREHLARVKYQKYVTTIGGRRIKIEGLDSYNQGVRRKAERKAVNYQIQPSGADAMKIITLRYDMKYKDCGYLLANVHDEILGEVLEEKSQDLIPNIRDIFCNAITLKNVPIDTDAKIVSSWADK